MLSHLFILTFPHNNVFYFITVLVLCILSYQLMCHSFTSASTDWSKSDSSPVQAVVVSKSYLIFITNIVLTMSHMCPDSTFCIHAVKSDHMSVHIINLFTCLCHYRMVNQNQTASQSHTSSEHDLTFKILYLCCQICSHVCLHHVSVHMPAQTGLNQTMNS